MESSTYGTFTNVWSSLIMYRHGFGNHHIHRTGNLIRQLSSLVVASVGRGAPIKLLKEETAEGLLRSSQLLYSLEKSGPASHVVNDFIQMLIGHKARKRDSCFEIMKTMVAEACI